MIHDMELHLRKHIKNIHANKNISSETSTSSTRDKNDNEIIDDEGQGFMNPRALDFSFSAHEVS